MALELCPNVKSIFLKDVQDLTPLRTYKSSKLKSLEIHESDGGGCLTDAWKSMFKNWPSLEYVLLTKNDKITGSLFSGGYNRFKSINVLHCSALTKSGLFSALSANSATIQHLTLVDSMQCDGIPLAMILEELVDNIELPKLKHIQIELCVPSPMATFKKLPSLKRLDLFDESVNHYPLLNTLCDCGILEDLRIYHIETGKVDT